jgi:hypothetical protein
MINRLAGDREAVTASVYVGESWLDGKPSLILDYAGHKRFGEPCPQGVTHERIGIVAIQIRELRAQDDISQRPNTKKPFRDVEHVLADATCRQPQRIPP